MHVLFAISILALVALLLASAAIVRHVRRSRRRRRRFLEDTAARNSASTVHEVNFSEGQRLENAPRSAVFEPEPEIAPPPFPSAAAAIHSSVTAGFPASASMLEPETVALAAALEAATRSATDHAPEPEQTITDAAPIEAREVQATVGTSPVSEAEVAPESPAEAEPVPDSIDRPETRTAGVPTAAAPPESQREPAFSAAARQLAAGLKLSTTQQEAAAPDKPTADPQRSSKISSAKHLLTQLLPPMDRPDWAYFNKDMGDLSDPEAPRSRARGDRAIKQRHKPA